MKKLFIIVLLVLFCVGQAYALSAFDAKKKVIARQRAAAGGGTDYTADANCMGAWLMNGGLSAGTDNETDVSGNSATLVETSGDIPNSATVPAGWAGTSRDFTDSETEYLADNEGGSTDIYGSAFSFCVWSNMDTDTADDQMLIAKWGTTPNKQFRFYYDDSANNFKFEISSNGTDTDGVCISATGQSLDTYQFWCGVYNGSTMTLYLNSAVDTNGASNPKSYSGDIHNGGDDFYIGGIGTLYSWDGLIDEPILFNDALIGAEILEMYQNGIDGDKGANDQII